MESLADELCELVISGCGAQTTALISRLNRRWRKLARRESVWRALALDRWGCLPRTLPRRCVDFYSARRANEGDAIIFYAVVARCSRSSRAREAGARVVAEACLAPGGYPAWWRNVAADVAKRAQCARGPSLIGIDSGDPLPNHATGGSSKLVLITSGCDWDGDEAHATFYACLALLPLVDTSRNGSLYLGRRRAVYQFVQKVRDWHRREVLHHEVAEAPAPARRRSRSENGAGDALARALLDLGTADPPKVAELDVGLALERSMTAMNATLKRGGPDTGRVALRPYG